MVIDEKLKNLKTVLIEKSEEVKNLKTTVRTISFYIKHYDFLG